MPAPLREPPPGPHSIAQTDSSEVKPAAHGRGGGRGGYRERIALLERIISEQQVVSLPARDMVVRLASEAESAAVPSPLLRPPRLLGNTGEMAELVLPRTVVAGNAESRVDDYTFAAASWTLAVHEGRPGHELQITSLLERGVSKARAI